jgi:hypothetical protein
MLRLDVGAIALIAALTLTGTASPATAAQQTDSVTPEAATPHAGTAAQAIDTLALESHAWFLSHDLLEGRHPASRGERVAANYLISRLRALGLGPLPSADYRLPVPLTAVDVDLDRAHLRLSGHGGSRAVRPPDFYHRGGGRVAFRDFEGPLLFAGAASGALDALEGRDLTGAVVVLTPPWSGLTEVEPELIRRGAAGAIQLIPDGTFYGRLRIVRGPTRYFLPDEVEDPANQSRLPSVIGGPELIAALGLEDETASDDELESAYSLGIEAELDLPFTTEDRTGYNVAGFVPGADPALRDEFVVYVAHYDHIGYGQPTAGDSLWNGFIDNAAGSSTLLEAARVLAADPPARSVAFLWVTAEEQGLLGANWFVHEPPFPLERIRAVLNIDGGAPPAPPTEWGIVGADASWAGETARRVVEERGWSVTTAGIGPQSDHWPFAQAGVAATMLFPGSTLEGLSEEEAQALTERWLHPHTPDDEWSQDFPFSGLERYAELALEIGRALAEANPAAASDGSSSR